MTSAPLQKSYYHPRSRFREILSTINAVLCIAGYQFFIIIAGNGDGALTTFFFAAQLAISLLTICFTYGKYTKINAAIIVLFVYWILLFIRFYYDMYIRTDIPYIEPSVVHSHERLMFRTILPAVAIITGYYYIDFKKVFSWSFFLITIGAIYTFFSSSTFQSASDSRSYINESFGVLVTGHFGVVCLIMCALMFTQSRSILKRIYIIIVMAISALILLRSGSRGPIFALMMVTLIWVYANSKKGKASTILLILGIFLAFIFQDLIIKIISMVSPIIVNRFEQHAADGGQFSDRIDLWLQAWEAFKQSPIIGEYFGLYRYEWFGKFYWCHNAFVDTIMQLGIVGAILFIIMVIKMFNGAISLIVERNEAFWLGLLAVESMSKIMLSYAFYTDPFVTQSLVFLYLLADHSIINKSINARNSESLSFNSYTNI